jgi:hypothetical protein
MNKKMCELIVLVSATLDGLLIDSVQSAARVTTNDVLVNIVVESDYSQLAQQAQLGSENSTAVQVSTWLLFAFDLFFYGVGFYFGDRYFRDIKILRNTLNNFDVAKAKLAQENDRALLLGIINELFTEQAADLNQLGDAPMDQQSNTIQDNMASASGSQSPKVASDVSLKLEAQDVFSQNMREAGEKLPEGQSSNSKHSAHQEPGSTGLAAFNRSIKVNVQHQLPTTGPRSWCVLGYKTTVLLSAIIAVQYRSLFDFHDFWGYEKTGSGNPGGLPAGGTGISPFALDVLVVYKNWRSIVEEKFGRNFRVSREMRDEILVYDLFLTKF